MKRLFLFYLFIFGTFCQIKATTPARLSECQTRQIAMAFANTKPQFAKAEISLASSSEVYIYNIGSQGFVIISGNTVLPPILGWSDQGTFPNLADAPENFVTWLNHYSNMIQFAETYHLLPDANIQCLWDTALQGYFGIRNDAIVGPLIDTHWNQDCYYNEYCPATQGDWWDEGPCGHVYAGCVACAMSQVMKYWDYPTMGFGSHSYYHGTYGLQSADFGATTYHWEQMPNSVWDSNDAVATLMYHCGVSVNMNYSANGSGAYSNDVETAMRTYFGYCAAKYRTKTSYSNEAWDALLKAELDLARPVYYSGSSDAGGHAFVCDGYDNEGLFHFNFGWSGAGDGFYSTYEVNGFNQNQAVVSNLYPVSIQADANHIIYVTPDGTGNGSSWENATSQLDLAVSMSKDGQTQVWVKSGTYYGDTTDIESAFYITSSNRVYGSFKGNEAPGYDLSQRNFETNPSILDGQNQRRVLTLCDNLSMGTAAVWDGFTLRNGASGTGAGAYLNNFVTLCNCIIKNNTATIFGGGIYINGSGETSHVNLNNCIISDNNATLGGGVCDRLGSLYTNSRICNNTATIKGGGIYFYTNTKPTLKNCIISNNTSKIGGGMYVRGKITAYNCDFVRNFASESIGGIWNENRYSKYYSCILWGNEANGQSNQTDGESSYEYCAVEGGIEGSENISLPAANNGAEPGWYVRFNHPAQGAGAEYHNDDWSLHPRSICLNAGKPNTTGIGTTDIAGNLRLQNGRIDIGAYESCASLTLTEDVVYENNDYWFHNCLLTEPGYYTALLEGQDCDSVIGLTLIIIEGMEEVLETAVQVWPNPTTGLLRLEGNQINKVEVYNLLGQKVLQATTTDSIDLSRFERGVYFLTVNQNGKDMVFKIIKE